MFSDAGRLTEHTLPTGAAPGPTPPEDLIPEPPFRSTTVLHGLSMLTASITLGLAVQDAGLCSLCLNPFFAILTMAYHTVILALIYIGYPERRIRQTNLDAMFSLADYDLYPLAGPFGAGLLSLAWMGAFIAMTVVLATRALVFPLPAFIFHDTLVEGNALVYDPQKDLFQFGTVQVAIPQTTRVGQKIQIMLCAVLFAVLGNIAVRGFLGRVRACRERGDSFV